MRRIVISGCSGGGKSTLLKELKDRGFHCFEEPDRAVVVAERASGGSALPWEDAPAFMDKVIARGVQDWARAATEISFYDRCLIDAVTWFERQSAPLPARVAGLAARYRYDSPVFLAPTWLEIFVNDINRRHAFTDAAQEYAALLASYPAKGYDTCIVPKMPVRARADWLLDQLSCG